MLVSVNYVAQYILENKPIMKSKVSDQDPQIENPQMIINGGLLVH